MVSADMLITAFHELIEVRRRRVRDSFPTVLGVGAGRCGTTTLHNIFSRTPGIYVPPVKEVNFFGRTQLSKELYEMYFSLSTTEAHRCEISPYYLTQNGVPEQIHADLGSIKIIIQVRDPIDRFISHYRHHLVSHGIAEFCRYVDLAIRSYTPDVHARHEWYLPEKSISQSLYYNAISRYVEIFAAENVLVIDYPELHKPERLCRALSRFLDLAVDPALVTSSNEAAAPAPTPGPTELARLRSFFKDDYQRAVADFTVGYELLAALPEEETPDGRPDG